MRRRLSVRIGVLTSVLLFCSTLASAGVNSWSTNGPPGGYFRALEASSTEADVYYAAFLRSLHKSIDGGNTWTRVRDFPSQINALVVDPSDGRRIFVASIYDGLFRSDDGGASFTLVASSVDGIWGVGLSGTTLYYCTNARRVFRSPDLGATWSMAAGQSTQVLGFLLVDPADSNSLFGLNGNFLVRSTDGGTSWTQSTLPTSLSDIEMIAANTLIGVGQDGVYRSTDNGVSWTHVLAGGFYRGLALDPNEPGVAVAAAGVHLSRAPIYRTQDFGATWTFMGDAPNGPGEGLAITRGSQSRVVLVNSIGARRSFDNGGTWTEVAQPPMASSVAMATTVAPNAKVYGFSLGILSGSSALYSMSSDFGWTRLNLTAAADQVGSAFGQTAILVRPGVPNTLYIAPFGDGFFRSTDGGSSWTRLGAGLGNSIVTAFGIDPTSPDTMYAKMSPGTPNPASALFRSVDGGATWSPYTTTLPFHAYSTTLVIDPSNPERMFLPALNFASLTGALYVSVDRGVNWSTPLTNQEVREVAVDPTDSNFVYAASTRGLQVSSNGGASFIRNAAFTAIVNNGAMSVVVDPQMPTTLYAASMGSTYPESPYVLRSVDRGQTWEILRDKNATPSWFGVGQLLLDPNVPGLIHASTSLHGVATLEIAPDLSVTLPGHSGQKQIGAPTTLTVRVQNAGPFAATGVNVVTTLPQGLDGVSASADVGTCIVAGTTVTCTRPAQPSGEITNITIGFTPGSAMALDVTSAVSARERDPVMANNSAQASATAANIPVPPSTTGGKGGGGGAADAYLLLLLGLIGAIRKIDGARRLERRA